MPQIRHIGIVGAGLAGLATAVAASAAGASVEVFEAGDRLAAPPTHIDVVPTLLRDLVALGVAEACVRRGFAYRGTAVADAAGRPGFEIPMPALAGPRWPAALGMLYADLLRVLHDAAQAQGTRLHWRTLIERVDPGVGGPSIASAAGTVWRGDLLVLAGACGVAGLDLPLGEQIQTLPQRWDHVLLPRPRGLDRSTWVLGPNRRKALLVPVSVAQVGLALLRSDATERSPTSLRADLAGHGAMLASLAEHLHDDTALTCRPVRTGLLPGAWHVGAALCVGSSAHVMPPHFGQAAAQSVEDATVLGDLLRQGQGRSDLLEGFMLRRAGRAARVLAVTAQAAKWDLHPEASTDLPALAARLAPIVEPPA